MPKTHQLRSGFLSDLWILVHCYIEIYIIHILSCVCRGWRGGIIFNLSQRMLSHCDRKARDTPAFLWKTPVTEPGWALIGRPQCSRKHGANLRHVFGIIKTILAQHLIH